MNDTFMKEKPVFPLIMSMALPMVISMLVNSLYNIVDSFFVAQISENAMTALSLVFPVQNFANAIAIGFGIGISSQIAICLGAGNRETASKAATHGLALSGLHGVILTIGCILVMPGFLALFTGDADVIDLGIRYSTIVFLFATINTLNLAYEKIFQGVGKMKITMIGLLVGCVSNIILDPLLIFGLGPFPALGIEGAALATGLGQSIPAIAGLIFFFTNKKGLCFTRFRVKVGDFFHACYNGSSEMVSQLAAAIITFLFNSVMMRLAGANGVAAITIILYGEFLFNSFHLGFAVGIAPIVGFQYGAQNKAQLKRIYKTTFIFVIASSVVITVIAAFLAKPIVSIFTKDPGTWELASVGFQIFAINFLFSGVNIASSGFFTALSNGKVSALISFCRTLLFTVIFLLVLPRIWGLNGAWVAIPSSELCTLVLSVCMHVKYFIKKSEKNYILG